MQQNWMNSMHYVLLDLKEKILFEDFYFFEWNYTSFYILIDAIFYSLSYKNVIMSKIYFDNYF